MDQTRSTLALCTYFGIIREFLLRQLILSSSYTNEVDHSLFRNRNFEAADVKLCK